MTIKVSFWNLKDFADEFMKRHLNVEVLILNDEMDDKIIRENIDVSDYVVIPHHSCSRNIQKYCESKIVFIVPTWHTPISQLQDDLAVSLFGP